MSWPPPFSVGVLLAMAALVGVVQGSGGGGSDVTAISCGSDSLTDRYGVIQTPNFPNPPSIPLFCRWVINASWANERNVTIYLTQQYVLSGLRIYGYVNYNDKDKELMYGNPDDDAIETEYVRSNRPYVAVELNLTTLVGNHLRVLTDLQEVYGFNITYEVTSHGEAARGSCLPIMCGFVGQCYASLDFKNYSCECPSSYPGPNCNLGPMCKANPCKNGGKCRSAGTESIVCICERNFTGALCQYPPIEEEVRECEGNDSIGCSNSSGFVVKPGRMLYTVNLSITDWLRPISSQRYICDKVNLTKLLSLVTKESEFNLRTKLLLALNLTMGDLTREAGLSDIYNLVIVNMTSRGEMTFQFKTYEISSKVSVVLNNLQNVPSLKPLVRWSPEAIEDRQVQKCMERDIYISSDSMFFTYHPALYLQQVVPTKVEPMLPGKQQLFSCVVTGSPNVSFSWFKENQLVDPEKSRKRIWTEISFEANNTVTSLLGIDNVSPLDNGRWTCVVRDGQFQQSRSVDSYVLQSPSVYMLPPMLTTRKGEKIFLSCILLHFDHVTRNEHVYSWTRNGVPFSTGDDHVIEPLEFPNGCLLRIQNINESATYTCLVESDVGRASASVRVEVVFVNTAMCDPEDDWPSVPVDSVATIECPEDLLGSFAKRRCSAVIHPTSSRIIGRWDDPDYSACVPTKVIPLIHKLKEISQGYAPSTPEQILQELFSFIAEGQSLRPRQGEALLAIAMDSWRMSDRPQSHNQMLQIIDLLLTSPKAIASPKYINSISRVAGKAAMAKIKFPQSVNPPISLLGLSVSYWDPSQTNSLLQVEKARPSWCTAWNFLNLGNHPPIPFVALELKTLQDMIPYRSRLNSSDGFYQILSTIAITSLPENGDAIFARKHTSVEITFENMTLNLSTFLAEHQVPYWNVTCAYAQSIEYSTVQWDLGSCTTRISRIDEGTSSRSWLPWTRSKALVSLQSQVSVQCFCPIPGTCAVLLTGFTQKIYSILNFATYKALWLSGELCKSIKNKTISGETLKGVSEAHIQGLKKKSLRYIWNPDGEVSSIAVVFALWCCAVEATAALILPFVDSWKENLLKANQSQITAPSQIQSQHSSVAVATSAKTSTSEAIIFRAFHVTSCTNTALFAIIMAVTMCKWDTSFPGVLLQCLLLLGISLPTAQLYLVAVELGAFSAFPTGSLWPRQYSRSHAVTIALSIGPVVIFLILWLSIRDLRATLSHCWTSWMEWGEPVSWALAVPSFVMATVGIVMAGVSRRFATMAKYSKRVQTDSRSGFLFRLGAIAVCQLAFLLATISYTSAPGLPSHVAMVVASFLLGCSLLLCYVLRLDKQWPLLSVVWCSGKDFIDPNETTRPSTSPTNAVAPGDCQSKWRRLCDFNYRRKQLSPLPNQSGVSAPNASSTQTAHKPPDSLRPLIVSPAKIEPQSNGYSKTTTRLVFGSRSKCRQPSLTTLPSSSKISDKNCLTSRSVAEDLTGGGSLPLREFDSSSLKKFNGYLSMHGRGTEGTSTSTGQVPHCEFPVEPIITSRPFCSAKNLPSQPITSRPQYHFRRMFLRLDDIEESSSAS